MNNSWNTEEFYAADIKENLDTDVFVVPKYQRGLVWSEQQKIDLVDSIKKGLPFGILLLYKDEEGKYQVIDGLQRSNTIAEFVDNPAQFFDEKDIDPSAINEILKIADVRGEKSVQEEKVKELLLSWVKTHESLNAVVEEMQFYDFGVVVSKEFPTCVGRENDIGTLIKPTMQNFKEICKTINGTRIPAIVMKGSNEYLPVVFERINSRGTTLSKYQVFAATWSDDKYKLKEVYIDIVKANRDRYDNMLDGESTIEGYDSVEFTKNRDLNMFEIAFGFGKFLCQNWPHLFGKSKEYNQVESVGFNLINACIAEKTKNIQFLNTNLENCLEKNKIDINDFLDKIVGSIEFVDKCIGKYSKFKSNSRANSGQRPLHPEYQIISIIASVFLSKYATLSYNEETDIVSDVKFDLNHQNTLWKRTNKKLFEENVGKIYIIENLQHRWTATGDKKLEMIFVNPSYYTRKVDKSEFEATLDSWFDNLNNERDEYKRVASPKEPELLILAALYLSKFTAVQQIDSSNYDIEHIATQKLMKNHLIRFDGELRLPISSIGNLCLLPEYVNRSKKDNTVYYDKKYLKKTKLTIHDIESKYTFTESSDLGWIYDDKCSAEELEKQYNEFLIKRFNCIKEKLKENYASL